MSPTGRRRYVTQADVARAAGVSRPLVSLVMQGSEHVSAEKRQKVLEAAASLGYLNNGIATSLAGNRSHCIIGFLAQSLTNPVFIDVFESLAGHVRERGHRVIVMQGGFDIAEEDRSLRDLVTLRPDGIVLAGYAGSTSALGAAVNSLPVVAVTRKIEMNGVASIYSNDPLGAELAVDHLAGLGHRDIVHLALPADIPYEERAAGFRSAMAQRGLRGRVVFSPVTADGAADAITGLIEERRLPTAIFCGNDVQAMGVLNALSQHGLSVPRDVSVVSHDDTVIAAQMGLASVSQNAARQGALAADVFLRMIAQDDPQETPETHCLTPHLVVRGSTSPPRAA